MKRRETSLFRPPIPVSVAFLDGKFVRADRARISVFDRGLLFADAIFETVRAYRGVPYRLDLHLRRLRQGAAALGFRVPRTDRWWAEMVDELLRRNRAYGVDRAVRLTVTRGVGGDGLLPPARPLPTLIASVRAIDARLPRLRQRGVAVVLAPFHQGLGSALCGLKTTGYATAVLAKRAAAARHAFEAIYSSPDGELFEGATSNLFVIRKGRLSTPPVAGALLPGITRSLVLDLAAELGLEVREERVTAEGLRRADEAFLTATTIELLPIRSVDGQPIGRAVRPFTARLQQAYCAIHPTGDCRA